ncbi:MAG: tRNA preQ1(34) S-adenosylmethionine ribosyltransferase-isomerase QueA [Dissulfurispiraceae bacterium]
MKTADFDFHLPPHFIATRPAEARDQARLLVIRRDGGLEHKSFCDITAYLNEGDMLLLNDTKVFPARLIGTKPSGGKIDVLLLNRLDEDGLWQVMCRGKYSGKIVIGGSIEAQLLAENDETPRQNNGGPRSGDARFLRFLNIGPAEELDTLWRIGFMPLPPYIKRVPDDEDKRRYQTVYAEAQGSVAAPTAGLHFTEKLLDEIRAKGVVIRRLTLHVGPGTFRPIKTESLEGHKMDPEYFEIGSSLIDEITHIKAAGGRLVSVGTTTTRAIEGYMSGTYRRVNGHRGLTEGSRSECSGRIRGLTNIFIHPGHQFRAADSLITNFHLPRSTPLMLASAFVGYEKLSQAYQEAIHRGYRFFSYGDAMLIL